MAGLAGRVRPVAPQELAELPVKLEHLLNDSDNIEELSKEYTGKINVGKLNVDHNPNVSINYGITSIPAILFIKGGKVVDKQIGAVPKSILEKKIQAHL